MYTFIGYTVYRNKEQIAYKCQNGIFIDQDPGTSSEQTIFCGMAIWHTRDTCIVPGKVDLRENIVGIEDKAVFLEGHVDISKIYVP